MNGRQNKNGITDIYIERRRDNKETSQEASEDKRAPQEVRTDATTLCFHLQVAPAVVTMLHVFASRAGNKTGPAFPQQFDKENTHTHTQLIDLVIHRPTKNKKLDPPHWPS